MRGLYYIGQTALLAPFVFVITFIEFSPPAWRLAIRKSILAVLWMANGLLCAYLIKVNF